MEPVRVTTARGVMTATLVDEENRNALGSALLRGLMDAINAANSDSSVRALVITNEGSTFCAGANLKEQSGAVKVADDSKIGFHDVLEDVSMGRTSERVKQFFVEAYVRGALRTQHNVGFEESTACFTLRRYRDGWNRKALQRVEKRTGRSLKVKAAFCAKGSRDQFLREHAAAAIRRTAP